MTTNKAVSLMDEVPREVKPYVRAMLGASGLSEFDAITSVLFAIATHLDLEQYPILVYLGARGTAKSEAMKQLFLMCKGAKLIGGRTDAAHRNALKEGVRTAFVDEADNFEDAVTDLYTKRYSKQTGTVDVNEPARRGWELVSHNVFGATVMAKRTAIADEALRSRCIIIRTTYHPENYKVIRIGDVSGIASSVATRVERSLSEIGGVDRVWQIWSPLVTIAKELGMDDWYNKALEIQVQEAEALEGRQGYEPSDAILQAIDIACRDEVSHERKDQSVKISDVVRIVKEEFSITLKASQIRDEANSRGFETGTLHGYPVIKVKKDLLDKLLPEEG